MYSAAQNESAYPFGGQGSGEWNPLVSRLAGVSEAFAGSCDGTLEEHLVLAAEILGQALPDLSGIAKEDTLAAIGAMDLLAHQELSGVTDQYFRIAHSSLEVAGAIADEPHLFFCVWRRTETDPPEPCVVVGTVSGRNKAVLRVTRSIDFVNAIAERLKAHEIPDDLLKSRVQSFTVHASAGQIPAVLFSDFVLMDMPSDLTASKCGGIVFNSFGDSLFEQIRYFARVFPEVGEWLCGRGVMNADAMRMLAAAHVQAHDLCGHSLPFDLQHPTRLKVDRNLRAPLEEMYADTQAMWIYSADRTRAMLREVLSEGEMDAVPLSIAVKRLTHYARLDGSDHDARCSWMMFEFWRRHGIIDSNGVFDIAGLGEATNELLDRLLRVEHAIGDGEDAYEEACRSFTEEFSVIEPVSGRVTMPEQLADILDRVDRVRAWETDA